jgi:dinuclear metal center YbgI/SA1388 family protein
MISINQIISHLESVAPSAYQESYDNAGLLTGNDNDEAKGAVICLDATEDVIQEAIDTGCNLVISHHPIIFKGLKKLTGSNYVERTVIKAIRHHVAIYAIHTNLDNVYHQGVNAKIAQRLGLKNTRILAPKKEMKKLSVIVAPGDANTLRQALFAVGAGNVSTTSQQSFATLGVGTANMTSAAQLKLEIAFPCATQHTILRILENTVPGAPVEITSLENASLEIGSGLIGELPKPINESDFLKNLKKVMHTGCVRHTRPLNKPVSKVALCGGSGSFLLSQAIKHGADAFVTGDYKYHDFFDAEGSILIADVGHYESEQFTMELLQEIIAEKFPTFATRLTKVNTNPVLYL